MREITNQPKRVWSLRWIGMTLLLILVGWGCHPALQKEAVKLEDAMHRTRIFHPESADDMDPSSLENAIQQSLLYLSRLDPESIFQYGADKYTCKYLIESHTALLNLVKTRRSAQDLSRAIEKDFIVYKASGRKEDGKVLFTGYYEPTFEASLKPDETYKYPIYKAPDDLISIDLSPFGEEFKGKRIVARIAGKKVIPYFTRKEIEEGRVLAGKNLELAWLKDPVDVAFLQVQGSGILKHRDQTVTWVGFGAKNGRPYRPIGKYLMDRGWLSKEEVSMQSIRRYLYEHPEIREEVLNSNPSYVFFRSSNRGPFGSLNVALTPGRSIALDSRFYPRGALCLVKTSKPVVVQDRVIGWKEFSRFVLNQDTGGAIRGPARADLFWGSDAYAEIAAGYMKQEGELYFLVKKPD